ncbi:MAG: metallophosphoesterase [bacterium]
MRRKLFLLVFLAIFLQVACFGAKFSFAVFGDNRDGEAVFADIIKKVNKDKDIKFVMNTGDFTSSGSDLEYEKYWQMAKSCNVKIYDAIGNHDLGLFNVGQRIFKKKYGETYYYFDQNDSRFIVLDNARSKGMGRKQLSWLKDVLDTKKSKFVFMHKPLFDPTGTYPNYVMTPKADNEALNKLLIKAKVRYVFSGHIHGYGREERGGVVYIITAGSGAPLYLPAFNGGFYHYVKVTVDGPKISDEVVKVYND